MKEGSHKWGHTEQLQLYKVENEQILTYNVRGQDSAYLWEMGLVNGRGHKEGFWGTYSISGSDDSYMVCSLRENSLNYTLVICALFSMHN